MGFMTQSKPVEEMSNLELDAHIDELCGLLDDAMTEQNVREHQPDMSDDCEEPPEPDDGMTDVEADADTLRMAGMGTDEDYGFFGSEYDY